MNEAIIIERVKNYINQHNSVKNVLEYIGNCCNNEFYIVGGFLRDSILGGNIGNDIDIMTINKDNRIHHFLSNMNIPYTLNRHGIRKYDFSGVLVEIYEPYQFQTGFNTIIDCLKFYDLKINAIALNYSINQLLNPLGGVEYIETHNAGINFNRWLSDKTNDYERTILLIRLVKILEKYSFLKLEKLEIELALKSLKEFDFKNWKDLKNRCNCTLSEFKSLAEFYINNSRNTKHNFAKIFN